MVKITAGIVIVLDLRQQAFVLFHASVHFFSPESPLEFFGRGSGGMARLTPDNEENEVRHCFHTEKPYLPLSIDGIAYLYYKGWPAGIQWANRREVP